MNKPLSKEEILTLCLNANHKMNVDRCKFINIVNCYRIGKALIYLHLGECNSEGNDRKIKYTLVRPDLNYCETGEFDYIVGFDVRDYLTDIYFSRNFNEF